MKKRGSSLHADEESIDAWIERDDGMQRFLPSTGAWQALRPFLWEVEQRKLPFAKVQIAGPFTLRWVLRTTQGEPLAATGDGKAIERQIFRLVLARALALSRRLRETGARPVIFLDEPGLYAFDRRDPQHLVSLQELRVVVLALRRDGAGEQADLVGVRNVAARGDGEESRRELPSRAVRDPVARGNAAGAEDGEVQ